METKPFFVVRWREEAARRSQGSSTAPTAPSTPPMEHRPPLLAVLPAAVSTAVPSAVALDLSTVQTIEPDAKPSVGFFWFLHVPVGTVTDNRTHPLTVTLMTAVSYLVISVTVKCRKGVRSPLPL